MKKNHILLMLHFCFIVPASVFSQAPPVEWQTTFGGNKIDLLYAAQVTANGGCVVGGSSNSNLTGDKSQNNKGGFDYWIAKLDQYGGLLWEKTIGGNKVDYLITITNTMDGGYLLGGESQSGISGDKSQGTFGNYDYWIVKTDATGNVQWDKTFGGSKGDYLNCVLATKDGGYLLAGQSESNATGSKSENCRGYFDYWIVKTDANGNKQWDRTYGGTVSEYLYSVVQTSDGKYFLGGTSGSKANSDKTDDSKGGTDYWLVKLNEDGSKAWDKTIGGTEDDFAYAIRKISTGGFLLGGYSESDSSGDKTGDCRGLYDFWIVKVDMNGSVLWDKTFGGDYEDELYALDQTNDGGFILGGYSESGISGDKTEACQGGYDYWIVRVNSSGNYVWDKTLGGSGEDELLSVCKTSDGKYVAAGYSYSNISGDKTENNVGGCDYWVVKLGSGSPQKEELNVSSDESLTVSPNPSSGAFALQLSTPLTGEADLTVTDIFGKEVYSGKLNAASLQSGQQVSLNPELPNGYYFVMLAAEEQRYIRKILIQR